MEVHGHRGCRGLLPENTLPAFTKAILLGVDAIEMDIAITKDRQVIVSHEPFMSRKICLDPEGEEIPLEDDMKHNLFKMSYETIKQFDCGLKFHSHFSEQKKIAVYKPLLSEVFQLSETLNPNIKYNIEIKAKPEYDGIYTPEPEMYVTLVLETIARQNVNQRTNLQSFDLRILEEIKAQDQNMKVALLIDQNETVEEKLNKLSYKPEIISPYYELLNPEIVKQLQLEGFKVIPWTVNTNEALKTIISYKVDGIITDYPDRLKAML